MIGRFYMALPYHMFLPVGEAYKKYSYQDEGYTIEWQLPQYTPGLPEDKRPQSITINEKETMYVNTLVIDFKKEEFQRRVTKNYHISQMDPPYSLIERALDSFLTRFCYVNRLPKPLDLTLKNNIWKLIYLDDEGKHLPSVRGLLEGLDGSHQQFSYIVMENKRWEEITQLPVDYSPPIWDSLLLDAKNAMPQIGTAIALTGTALEVFINTILDQLADVSKLSPELWKWLTDRGFYLKDPSIEEQYDILLKYFVGHSLKEKSDLWEGFIHLKKARNSFVHTGKVMLSNEQLSIAKTYKLIENAELIIEWVRITLPDDLKWPIIDLKADVNVTTQPIKLLTVITDA